jgi:hypothetical protein
MSTDHVDEPKQRGVSHANKIGLPQETMLAHKFDSTIPANFHSWAQGNQTRTLFVKLSFL